MTELLIVSNDVVGRKMAGPGIRAWEVAGALHEHGVSVALTAPGRESPEAPFPTSCYGTRGDRLRTAAEDADALLVQGLVLAHYPFLAAMDKPLVVDIYDPFVLENLEARTGQTASGRMRHHRTDLAALCGQLSRGDFFVCAGEDQRSFWLGMLTALGRVNPVTYDQDPELRSLIDVVPFGMPSEPPVARERRLRGVLPGIGPEDRIVLWGGGIWNWFDPLTLITAVGRLTERRDDVRLVFMGTRTPSPFVQGMAMAVRAEELARELGLLGRHVFFNRGWVAYDERADYLLEADVGASCHLEHIETRFAFRTRLLDYIWAGLPMLVTEGDVLARLVERESLGVAIPAEDVDATAQALDTLLDEPGGRDGYRESFDRVRATMTWQRAVLPLVRFLEEPRRAADMPASSVEAVTLTPTEPRDLPRRAMEVLREGGPLLLVEELVRYTRWLRRGR